METLLTCHPRVAGGANNASKDSDAMRCSYLKPWNEKGWSLYL